MQIEDVRPLSLFDGLSDEQLAQLVGAGREVQIEPGVPLFHEGELADSWWLLVDGALDLVRCVGREDTVVGRLDVPGRWAGGFQAWDEHGTYLATALGVAPGRLLQVPAAVLRQKSDEWFPFAGHLIEGLYRTARSIESTARQRESLVSLDALAAGLAHEINNPAAATTRAVDSLEEATEALLSSLARLAHDEISPRQFSALDALRRAITPPTDRRDALAVARSEDALSSWLLRHDVDRDWLIAPPLAAAGADVAWCEKVAEEFDGPSLAPALEWVASTVSVSSLLSEVKESTRRVSELVASVRSYTQLDRAAVQEIDVTDGLDSTLVMLGHRLRDGVVVVREYAADVPTIEAYAGELNQVWTNLISNAVDAMDGAGKLIVRTRADGDHVVVEIADTGPGMGPDVAARAFDAFYTTKDVGKGTGLGLDIARRIVVERHGGTITIDSRPGRTVLQVRLPVRLPGRSSSPGVRPVR